MIKAFLLLLFISFACFISACTPTPNESLKTHAAWSRFEGEPGATSFSALDQIIKPPWTRLTNTGMSNLNGGPSVTAGGLIFQAAGDRLWAYNQEYGEVLWSGLLPANGKGIPAIYAVNGRQYIVISAPGERIEIEGQIASYVAFSLPE